jgi:sRNA-binding carbon storage regulator CsrA
MMLVLKRHEGEWVEITHTASGDVLRVRVYRTEFGQAHLAFDDSPRNFRIERPERATRPPQSTRPAAR